jgi:hypothetical protein
MSDYIPIDGGLGIEREKTNHRVSVESAVKFKFFFVGLVFAILSFAIQFPLKSTYPALKISEASSWGLMAITGILALVEIGGFSVSETSTNGLTRWGRVAMWGCFLLGLLLLLASKIWASLQL